VPDRVLVSPARRALQTWERANASLVPGPPPIVDEQIYDDTVEALLAAIEGPPEDVRTRAVVGHDPSVGELVEVLDDGQGSLATRQEAQAGFRTGGVAAFLLAQPFAAITPGAATLTDVAVPGDGPGSARWMPEVTAGGE